MSIQITPILTPSPLPPPPSPTNPCQRKQQPCQSACEVYGANAFVQNHVDNGSDYNHTTARTLTMLTSAHSTSFSSPKLTKLI